MSKVSKHAKARTCAGFTLIELLVVVAIIAILAAMMLPAVVRAKDTARRGACVSNLRQVNLAVRLYADDFDDSLPVLPPGHAYPNGVGAYYKQLVKEYVGLSGPAAPTERVFTCPSDRKLFKDLHHAYTSYTFNGYELGRNSLPRITGKRLSEMPRPEKAVIVAEWTAYAGGSWHPYREGGYNNAPNVIGFADGHVASTKIYYDDFAEPRLYEPPAGYAYSWSGN